MHSSFDQHHSRKRRHAYHFGLLAEWGAAALLLCKGYRIVARRYRNAYGEIDLIAERFGTVAFIEVKARRTAAQALEALTPRQRQRVMRAAHGFLAHHSKYAGHCLRFDFMLALPWRVPRHLENAWQADE